MGRVIITACLGLIISSVIAQDIVKIAVIDDGFRLNHESIKDYIYNNPVENPFNKVDDDKNGFVNDIKGWDVSDGDSDVVPYSDIIADYYHGTFIASAICDIAQKYLGDKAHESIKIIPIKATSDSGDPNRLIDGHAGIQYATSIGADIIITAWNGGSITAEQAKIIQKAQASGTLIIASAGNEATDRPTPPASIDGVLAVSAIDQSGQKMYYSNYGSHIDISALGEGVKVASSQCDTCYMEGKNTSLAVAIVGGLAAAIKSQNPQLSNSDLVSIIKNSADPLIDLPYEHIGKLGSGMINMDRAISLANAQDYDQYHNSQLTEGTLIHNRNHESTRSSWFINPDGPIHKTIFTIDHIEPYNQDIHLYIKRDGRLIQQWNKNEFLSEMAIQGSNIELLISSSASNAEVRITYESEVLDSTNYHCQEEVIVKNEVGSINDGSGDHTYVNGANCQWKLVGPKGSTMYIEFTEMDTEPNVDYVYIFEGHKALQTNLLAKFSGQHIPPKIHTHSNEVLVWFMSDKQSTGQGWELEYVALSEEH